MGAAIGRVFPDAKVELVPGGTGDFIVTADGERIWDKRAMDDRFPEDAEVLGALRER